MLFEYLFSRVTTTIMRIFDEHVRLKINSFYFKYYLVVIQTDRLQIRQNLKYWIVIEKVYKMGEVPWGEGEFIINR